MIIIVSTDGQPCNTPTHAEYPRHPVGSGTHDRQRPSQCVSLKKSYFNVTPFSSERVILLSTP